MQKAGFLITRLKLDKKFHSLSNKITSVWPTDYFLHNLVDAVVDMILLKVTEYSRDIR